jgi:hypothetical protein
MSTRNGRWVGIDEAGYGPNLGPLVMTAVSAEGPLDRPPDLWRDLADTVDRAGGDPTRLWVDDSKRVYASGKGLDRLEAATLAALEAAGGVVPGDLAALFEALGSGTLAEVELDLWLDGGLIAAVPRVAAVGVVTLARAGTPLSGAPWRIGAVRSVVVGPSRFNRVLGETGSKASAHFSAFETLLRSLWDGAADGVTTSVRGDKHGGRHFYLDLLQRAFPGVWIDRGPEGPALSRYTIREGGRRLELSLVPEADAGDGLVALASMVSKYLRERWMELFNAYWISRVPGLRPTAGYPVDARRFRAAIEPHCRARGLGPDQWWRAK